MHLRSSRNTGEAKRTKGYFLSIFPYFSQFILYIIINILHFAWYSYRYLWAFLHLWLRVGYGAGMGMGHSKFTCGWPMLITLAEECGHTRCVYCFFLSFCPLICELQVQGGQTLLVIHIWDHFKPTERENPLCCILLGDFEQMRRGLSLLSMLAGLNQQEGKPFPLCFIGLLRRGNPFHHPYLFRLVQTNGEGFPSLCYDPVTLSLLVLLAEHFTFILSYLMDILQTTDIYFLFDSFPYRTIVTKYRHWHAQLLS